MPAEPGAGPAEPGPSGPGSGAGAPVFVVGWPRSGTTLLARMLAAHPRLCCGPETHLFSHLEPDQLAAAVADPAWPAVAVAALGTLDLEGQQVMALYGHDGEGLAAALAARRASVPALLQALYEPLLARTGAQRIVEKTPNHLERVGAVRAAFGSSPVLRIARDPRDACRSLRRIRWLPKDIEGAATLWRSWFEVSREFFRTDPDQLTVRYEDLVADPAGVLRAVCAAIGEQYRPGMLDYAATPDTVTTAAEQWKGDVRRPLEATAAHRWRRELQGPDGALVADEVAVVERVCAEGMAALGYT